MKKLASLLLALVMLISCVPAMAEDGETYTITINNATANHTYEAYQIFTGDLSSAEENDTDLTTAAVLANVKWGSSVAKYGDDVVSAGTDATAVADALTSETLDAFIEKLTLGTPVKTVNTQTNETYVIDGLAAGYYLVKDKDNTVTGNDAYTEFIIEVVENSTVTPKSSVPQVEKQVQDTNDSTDNNINDNTWQDSADHDIGDDVPFKLTATLADNVSAYDTYKIIFHDTLSAGLTYVEESAVVKFGDTVVTKYFDITYDKATGKLTISCDNVKDFNAGNNSVITVEYTAELNENAVIGAVGNPNEVYLQYSNNPNWTPDADGDGNPDEPGEEEPTGQTPPDTVIVFTYQVNINKVQEDGTTALTGAAFTLYKWEDGKQVDANDPNTNASTSDNPLHNAAGAWVVVKAIAAAPALSTFEFKGLDDGDYKLVETMAPAGYNLLPAPLYFTVTADHMETVDGNEIAVLELQNLTGGDTATGQIVLTPDVPNGTLSATVENQAGATLPETGGMGTTILYVGGGILVLAAIVLLIAKRRTNAE